MQMENLKYKIRSECKRVRQAISLNRRHEASHSLYTVFKDTQGLICSYASFQDELDTSLLNEELLKRGQLVLPRIEENDLKLYRPLQKNDLEYNFLGILEPKKHCQEISEVNLMLVPGIAFDQQKHRLGYGKGYYDRFLTNRSIQTVGVGFQECFLPALPTYPTDISLKQLILF